MGRPATGARLRKRPTLVQRIAKNLARIATPVAVALSLFLPVFFPEPSSAADLSLSSKTYLLSYERELAGGRKDRFAPLYEYLSADAGNINDMPVAFHFYGWGRADLMDASGSGKTSGDVGSAYLEYLYPQGNGQAKLGRFFLSEGVAVETLDGVFFKVTTPTGVGVSAFGGVPVEHSILDNVKGGDSLYGGRVFFARSGYLVGGASYLKEKGSFQGKDRELYGGDLWLRPIPLLELTAQVSYNRSVRKLASQRYEVRVTPVGRLDISGGYESYTYKGLFQTALQPAFLSPSVDNDDKVKAVFGVVGWEFVPEWTLEVVARHLQHDKANPGNANRGEVGLRHVYNDKKDTAGISAAAVTADRAENEYREFRGFGTYSPSKVRLSLDALVQQYKEEINGTKNAYQVVASAGYRLLPALHLSGDLTWTQSPTFSSDYAGLIRATLDLATTTGGKK